ncbi:hypothetical protein [Mycobacterium talmoniae]|uniref:Uncharacterized protein n=1 Tax=Mycobacterium talmoniae TaxID=1858794 RepID=A0A1S1N0T1_9MYCO|nr:MULTISPECIES: hypothetical protein [Mycobacterium]OHU94628.1 hypothetical protein BKN37_23550 [Mycobacterium talmoniae]PQM45588.1 hypothetical protein C1Y40_04235 [Mycobacterium talmoniae]TDH48757.1 hypothetical protein E2F47_22580 [Mycobacterium eburneum]
MSANDERTGDANQQQPRYESPQADEEGNAKARRVEQAYTDRPTVVMPGSGGTVAGTAINDWLDEEGNPKFGEPGAGPHAQDSPRDDTGQPHEPPV